MTLPINDRIRAERVIIQELEHREAMGIEEENEDVGDVEIPLPGTKEADRRKSKRVRTGKRWTQIIQAVADGDYTWDEFVSSLHPRELARGQLFDSRGGFSGRPPSLVPRAFHDACIKELMKRGKVLYQENYIQAIQAMTAIAQNTAAKDADRIKAAQFVIERLEGKAVERVEIASAAPWQEFVGGVVANVDEEIAIANAQDYLERRDSEIPSE